MARDSDDDTDEETTQSALIGNDGGFGLPDTRTYTRDDGTEGEIPPDEVFLPPIRTKANGWRKWHASHDCGRNTVSYVESNTPQRTSERYDWKLYCFRCGRGVRWKDVLYISEEWYYDRLPAHNGPRFADLWLGEERVLDLGPDPIEAELLEAIREANEEREERREAMHKRLNNTRTLDSESKDDADE